MYFKYDSRHTRWLRQRDPKLGAVMAKLGHIRRTVFPDVFQSLLRAIIGQQISSKAQDAIWARFCDAFSPIHPSHIATQKLEVIKACGISMRKAEYLREIAVKFASGDMNENNFSNLSDEAIRKELLSLRGVGPWTVEMLLIFTFQRPNILSFGDYGIQRGIRLLYGLSHLERAQFDYYYQLYSPYATVASFYLWEIAGGAVPELLEDQTPPPNVL